MHWQIKGLDEDYFRTAGVKWPFLDIIEKYTDNVRFCLICNYLGKIIPALQSRCTRFRFGPLNRDQIMPRLKYVIAQECVKATKDGKKALIDLACGDMRKVLNILQSTATAFPEVNEENVYTSVGHPTKVDITNILKWLLNSDFETSMSMINLLKINKGLALSDILQEVHTYLHRIEIPSDVLIELLVKLSDIEHRLARGASEKIQLGGLIGAFYIARSKIEFPENELMEN